MTSIYLGMAAMSAIVVVFSGLIWNAYRHGRKIERSQATQAELEGVLERDKIDEAVAGQDIYEKRKEALKWSRP